MKQKGVGNLETPRGNSDIDSWEVWYRDINGCHI